MYTKQTWVDGEVLSASKLNHIEDGVEENQLLEINVLNQYGYLGVVADYDNTTDVVVIPQQTVTVSNSGVQVQSDFPDPFPSSCSATMTVNGVDYEADYNYDTVHGVSIDSPTQDSPPYFYIDSSSGTRSSSQGCMFYAYAGDGQNQVSGTYTVKVTLHIPGAKWGIVQGSSSGGGSFD